MGRLPRNAQAPCYAHAQLVDAHSQSSPPPAPAAGVEPSRRRTVWGVVGVLSVAAVVAGGVALGTDEAAPAAKEKKSAAVPVRVVEVVPKTLALETTRRGELDADAAELSARTGGYLVEVLVGIGDLVEKGAILAQVEPAQADSALGEARAEVAAAQAAKKRAEAELAAARVEQERAKQALEKHLISAKEALALESRVAVLAAEVEAARANLARSAARAERLREQRRDTAVVAPFNGAVAERYVDEGTIVTPGTAVLRLVKGGPLRVRFRLAERDLGLVTTGMTLSVTTQATGDAAFAGKVVRVSAEVSRIDRTVAVEGLLDAEQAALKPGMYAEVKLALGQLEDALVVPSGSLVDRLLEDHRQELGVFVVEGDVAVWKKVTLLGGAGELTAVKGVEAGAQVVILGQASLSDGAPVRVTEAP